MMKVLKWAVIAAVILFILIQLIPVSRTNPPVTREVRWNSPETRVLAQRACFDCHSNETVWPWTSNIAPASWLLANHVAEGRSDLNFSEWDRPNSEAEEIPESVLDEEMPPWDYMLMHASARLTEAEKDALAAGLAETVRQDPPIEDEDDDDDED
jgi:hypothetical protein